MNLNLLSKETKELLTESTKTYLSTLIIDEGKLESLFNSLEPNTIRRNALVQKINPNYRVGANGTMGNPYTRIYIRLTRCGYCGKWFCEGVTGNYLYCNDISPGENKSCMELENKNS